MSNSVTNIAVDSASSDASKISGMPIPGSSTPNPALAMLYFFGVGLTDQWNIVNHAPTAAVGKLSGSVIDTVVVTEQSIVIDQAIITI